MYINPLGLSTYSYASTALTNNSTVLISAGLDLDGFYTVERPAQISAGRDIGDDSFVFVGLNFTDADVTSVVAGRDLNGEYYLYGPGALLLEAGRNMRKPVGSNSGYGFSVITLRQWLGWRHAKRRPTGDIEELSARRGRGYLSSLWRRQWRRLRLGDLSLCRSGLGRNQWHRFPRPYRRQPRPVARSGLGELPGTFGNAQASADRPGLPLLPDPGLD